MSYPKSLDEYSIGELEVEIIRRKALAKRELCTYCERNRFTKPCRFLTRHNGFEL